MTTSLANLAAQDFRAALSRCVALQDAFAIPAGLAVDRTAALVELLFIDDAGEAVAEPYGVITCKPRTTERIADGLVRYVYDLAAEIWLAAPRDDAPGDFVAGMDLDQVVTELHAQARGVVVTFEYSEIGSDQPVREDPTGAQAGCIGNLISAVLEGYDE